MCQGKGLDKSGQCARERMGCPQLQQEQPSTLRMLFCQSGVQGNIAKWQGWTPRTSCGRGLCKEQGMTCSATAKG